jgi:hypothetical protein
VADRLVRLRWDPKTKAYLERRCKEGLTKLEAIRCLKRYVAREVFSLPGAATGRLAA